MMTTIQIQVMDVVALALLSLGSFVQDLCQFAPLHAAMALRLLMKDVTIIMLCQEMDARLHAQ